MSFFYDSAASLYDYFAYGKVPSVYTYKTQDMKSVLDGLPPSAQKFLFMSEVPYADYSTIVGIFGKGATVPGCDHINVAQGTQRFFLRQYSKLYKSDITILSHINTEALNEFCHLGLTEHQRLFYEELQKPLSEQKSV